MKSLLKNNNPSILGLRGLASLFVLLGLLISAGSGQDAAKSEDSPDGKLFSVTQKLNAVMTRYRQLCKEHTNLAQNCSATAVNCRECPEGWLHAGDKCYHLSKDKMNWFKSRDSCAEMGSHLAILHNKEQHVALEKEARMFGGMDYYYWIGLSDKEVEGDWRWVDNTTLKNTFWNTVERNAEPDNHLTDGDEGEGEDCVTLDSYTQTWYDVPCKFLYVRICQMDAIPLY